MWFTADTHAYHRNIIKYCDRPYDDEVEMTVALASNINDLVDKNDVLWHLGDWSFGGYDQIKMFRDMIECQTVNLVLGNHDKRIRRNPSKYKSLFNQICELTKIRVHGQEIILCHYSMRVWDKAHYGTWQLYGHSHGSIPDYNKSFDVGVDCHDYKPISFDQVGNIMDTKEYKPIDHHKSN